MDYPLGEKSYINIHNFCDIWAKTILFTVYTLFVRNRSIVFFFFFFLFVCFFRNIDVVPFKRLACIEMQIHRTAVVNHSRIERDV